MSGILKKFFSPTLAPVFLLAVLGCLSLASLSCGEESFLTAKKQIIWFVFGLAVFLFFSRFFNWRVFVRSNWLVFGLYGICLFLMILLLVLGDKTRGAAGWFNFSFFSFQPAEIAKLALILVLARYFAVWHIEVWRLSRLLVSAVYAGLFFFLAAIQPDLGSAAIFAVIWLGMLLAAGLRFKFFVILMIIVLIFGFLGWHYLLRDYQKDRVLVFFNPAADPLGAGYNVIQAKIAIGSGGWFGRGLGQGLQSQLGFLPEAKTDFFFSSFVEEWGIAGGIMIFLAYGFYIFWAVKTGLRAPDNFSRLFVFGYLLAFIFQTAANLGANLGFLPVTGLPLPFLSYGGSNLLFHFVSLGIIDNVRLRSV